MHRALAIETSGRTGSVALIEHGKVKCEEQFPHGLRHATELLPLIDRLCRTHGMGPRDLRELYVSAGPGSFTGLRIGITLVKTLAFATGAKVVAVPSVDVLAANAPEDARHVIIVLDAKRGQIFTARFERQGDEWAAREPAHLDTLGEMLARSPRPAWLIGEGIPYHAEAIPQDESVMVTPEALWRARAGVVATIGMEMSRRGQFTDPFALAPLYIRRPEAEEKLDKG